jgi:hypothetical protein
MVGRPDDRHRVGMEATSESASAEDWLAGAIVEAGGDIGPEPIQVPLEGLEFGLDEQDHNVA